MSTRYRETEMAGRRGSVSAAQPESNNRTKRDGADLAKRSADENHNRNSGECDRGALAVGGQALGHAPDRLRDHGNRDQLQAVENPFGDRAGEGCRTEREGEENDCRRYREGEPRRQSAEQAVAAQDAEREAHLAGSRPRQELTERDDVSIAAFAEPFSPFDEFCPEVTERRDRPAERRKPQLEERGENFGDIAGGFFRHAFRLHYRGRRYREPTI